MKIKLIPGLYGKLPALGDFVSRCLPTGFIGHWDDWLQRAMVASREQMGNHWLDCYLTCPIYRFILGPGSCGEKAAAGVLMPSVDKVGRYFPLTLVALAEAHTPMAHLLLTAAHWFDRLEELALSALKDSFDLAQLEQELQMQVLVVDALDDRLKFAESTDNQGRHQLFYAIGMEEPHQMATAYGCLLNRLLDRTLPAYSLWSVKGSNEIAPSLSIYDGLPEAEAYTDFLTGLWEPDDWDEQTVGRPLPMNPKIDKAISGL